jgi:hypothetical protein
MICSRAPFFAKATSGEWNSAHTETVTLAHAKKGVFEAYLHWVYSSTVEMSVVDESPECISAPSFLALAELWIFADMMLDRDLCNKIIDMTLAKTIKCRSSARNTTLMFIWERTASDSPLRTLHTDMTTSYDRTKPKCDEKMTDLPQDLIVELATRHLKGQSREILTEHTTERNICSKYHIHKEGESCS